METTPQVTEGDALATITGIVIANLDMAAGPYGVDVPWLVGALERIAETAYAASPHLRPRVTA